MKFLVITLPGLAKDQGFLNGVTTWSMIIISFLSPIF